MGIMWILRALVGRSLFIDAHCQQIRVENFSVHTARVYALFNSFIHHNPLIINDFIIRSHPYNVIYRLRTLTRILGAYSVHNTSLN